MPQLKDIKGLVAVPDNSLIILIILIIVIIGIGIALWYFYKKQKLKKNNHKITILNILKNIDFNNSKKAAYKFSIYANEFITDENRQNFELINQQLTIYKYKKQVNQLNLDLISSIKKFINDIK